MRTTKRAVGAAAILGFLVLGTAGGAARADEGAAPGVWVFDLRVVRVDPPEASGTEQPFALPEMRGAVTRTPWPAILAQLKARGATTLLLDQRVTTLDGAKASVDAQRNVPILALNQQDVNNAIRRSATVKTGCKVEIVPSEGLLDYAIHVAWAMAPVAEGNGPTQMTTQWVGTHPALADDTLVLAYREQVPLATGGPPKAVEIYALLTGRLVPAR